MCEHHGRLAGKDEERVDTPAVAVMEAPAPKLPEVKKAPALSVEQEARQVREQVAKVVKPAKKAPQAPVQKPVQKQPQPRPKVVVEEAPELTWDQAVEQCGGDEMKAAEYLAEYYADTSSRRLKALTNEHEALSGLLTQIMAEESEFASARSKRARKKQRAFYVRSLDQLAEVLGMGTLHLDEASSKDSAIQVAVDKVKAKMKEQGSLDETSLPEFMR